MLGGSYPGEKRTTGTIVRFANGLVPRNPGLEDAIPLGLEIRVRSAASRRTAKSSAALTLVGQHRSERRGLKRVLASCTAPGQGSFTQPTPAPASARSP